MFRITFIFGCLFFLNLLLITYVIKKPKLRLKNELYRIIILNVILLIIFEILATIVGYFFFPKYFYSYSS